MVSRKKRALLLVGAVVALVLVLGVTAVFAQATGSSDSGSTSTAFLPQAHPPGRGGFAEGVRSGGELLAEALGISVEELQAAQEEVHAAIIEQAVEDGLISEEQAQQFLDGNFAFRGPKFGFAGRGGFHGFGQDIDREALLADALGISVTALQAAQEEAQAAGLADMVDNGYLTQEQADMVTARQALKDYIDREALLAEALGMSVADLQAALEDGTSLPALIEESGLTFAELAEAQQAAHEAAVQEAVADGVISQAQADQILSGSFGGHGFGGGHGGFHGPGGGASGGPNSGRGFGGFGGGRGFGGPGNFGGGRTPTGVSI